MNQIAKITTLVAVEDTRGKAGSLGGVNADGGDSAGDAPLALAVGVGRAAALALVLDIIARGDGVTEGLDGGDGGSDGGLVDAVEDALGETASLVLVHADGGDSSSEAPDAGRDGVLRVLASPLVLDIVALVDGLANVREGGAGADNNGVDGNNGDGKDDESSTHRK